MYFVINNIIYYILVCNNILHIYLEITICDFAIVFRCTRICLVRHLFS